jgi:hypothetical protein
MKNAKTRQISTAFILIFIYITVAAASFHGYFSKWAFRDSNPWFSLDKMLDGTAARPYVYRQLIPQIANSIDRVTSPSIKESITKGSKDIIGATYARAKLESLESKYIFRYSIVYIMTFFSILVSMFLLREICIEVSKSTISGTLAPISFVLVYPFISTIGGYFYDYPEIAFFAASFLLALRKRLIWIIPIALVATLNKESFLFFIITLIPLIRPFASRYKLLIFANSNLKCNRC